VFITGLNDRMRLDSSGNLGLGVTPNASTLTTFEMPRGVTLNANTGIASMILGANATFNAGWVYKTSTQATFYRQQSGAHEWHTAPSGTAGNAISFTQSMTLTADGNLGVGTSSPTAKLEVAGVSAGGSEASGTTGSLVLRSRETIDFTRLSIGALRSSGAIYIGRAVEPSTTVADGFNGGLTGTTGGGAWVIDGDGSTRFLGLPSGAMTKGSAVTLTERARIDSSGNLLVGTTSAISGSKFAVVGSVTDLLLRIQNSSATTPAGIDVNYSAAAPNDTTNVFFQGRDTSAVRFNVRSNGGIANYSANDVNLSDRREKTNFAPAKSYLDTICAIPVQTFNYIDQNLEEDPGLTLGIVAQDVQTVAPELVMESNWGSKDDPKMRLSIYQTDLQYALMKCIQEQQAIINSLKARLDAANL
jgi:hypothetical protein